MKYLKFSLLVPVAVAVICLPSAGANSTASRSRNSPSAAKLYDKGKFSDAQTSYQSAVSAQLPAAKAKTDQLARELLGLSRSQAAAGNLQDAEKNFRRVLNLSEAMDMPRSFIDQARAGLVETRVKLGHAASQDDIRSAADLAPLPVPNRPTSTPSASVRGRSPRFPTNNGNFLPFLLPGQTMRDAEEDEYLRRCAVAYSEHIHGAQSLQAALSNLDLATIYANNHNYDAAWAPVQKVTAILPKLKPSDQRALSATLLESAVRFADADQPLLASQMTQPILKLDTPQWENVSDLSGKLSRLADSFQRKQDYSQAETFEKYAVALLERSMDAQDIRLANERLKLAALFEAENKSGPAIELYEMAIPTVENAGNTNQVLKPYTSLAALYVKTGSQAKTKQTALKLVKALANVHADSDRSWVRPCLDLSSNLARSGDLEGARQLYKTTFNHSEIEYDRFGFDYQVNEAVKSLISQLQDMGQPQEAENVYLAQIEARKNAFGETESVIGAYADLAQYYLKHRSFEKAAAAADHAAAVVKKFGRNSRFYHRLPELARSFQQQDQLAEALVLTQAAIDLNPDPSTNELRDAADNYMRAAAILSKQGNRDKAQPMLEKAVTMINKQIPPDLNAITSPFTEVVNRQFKTGRFDNACQLVTEMAQNVQLSQQTHFNTGYTNQVISRLAATLAAESMPDEACTIYKQCLDRQSKQSGPSSIEAASILQQYSTALRSSGKTQEAQEMDEGSNAIWDIYNRQNRGETGIYRPFAPLSETVRTYQMRRMTPDSST